MPRREGGTDALRRVTKQDSAAVHQQYPVGIGEHLLQPMFRQNHGQSQFPVELLQGRQKFRCGDRVKLAGRLVQNQHLRLHYHDSGKVQQLLLPAGQLVRPLAEPILNAEIACHFPDAAADHLGRKSQILQAERQLMPDLVCNDLVVRVLKHVADVRRRPFPAAIYDTAGQFARRCKLRLEQAQKRCLTTAGLPAYHKEFPAPHGKTDLFYRVPLRARIPEAQILDL